MKKLTTLCFLALLCLLGSELYGQVASPPTTEGTGAPVVVYGEVDAYQPMDSVKATFWKRYLGRFVQNSGQETRYLPTRKGNMFEGNRGKMVFVYQSPPFSSTAHLTVGTERDAFLDRFAVSPGDTVKILIDLKNGTTAFAGPAAYRYKVQHLVQNARKSEKLVQNPVFHTPDREGFLDSKNYRKMYRQAASNSPYRRMEFVEPGPQRDRWLKQKLSASLNSDPAFRTLLQHQDRLPPKFFQTIKADIIGQHFYKKAYTLQQLPSGDSALMNSLFDQYLGPYDAAVVGQAAAASSMYFPGYLLEKTILESRIKGKPFLPLLEERAEGEVRDRILGSFILSRYRSLPNLDELLDMAAATISTPDILRDIQTLRERQRTGNPLHKLTLETPEGSRVDLQDFRGKTLLLYFWFSGCKPSQLLYERHLRKLENKYRDNSRVKFISISTDSDKNTWLNTLDTGEHSSPGGTNLYIGQRDMHPFLEYYSIQAYPHLMIVDANGRLYRTNNLPYDYDGLTDLLEKAQKTTD